MLKVILTCLSLLLLLSNRKSWIYASSSLLILSISMSMYLNLSPKYILMSSMSATDLMSSTLLILTLWITSLMFIASYKIKTTKLMHNMFFIVVLFLLITLMLSFSSSNMLFFYIWFEASLIPTMVLIMMWGYQPERMQASMYLMIYTVTASLPLLMMILSLHLNNSTMMMPLSWMMEIPSSVMNSVSWAMLTFAFLVKLPLFSVHLWLPKAHVEAPVAGSMILAAILLKLGGYGLLRMMWMFQLFKNNLSTFIMSMALVGAILTSLICLRQSDMKSLIAYSSVGHMGILVAGTMSNSKLGLYGSLGMMIAHGLSSSALFCMANINYELFHTRSMTLIKGTLSMMPAMSLMWFMFVCANMAAPPSINLLSEILLISSTSFYSLSMTLLFMFTSFLTAAYSLHLYSNLNHGAPIMMTNPLTQLKPMYLTMLMIHLWPIIMLIMIPSSITLWC